MSEQQRRSERAPRAASISLRGRAHGKRDPAGAAESASRSSTVRSSAISTASSLPNLRTGLTFLLDSSGCRWSPATHFVRLQTR